MRRVAGSILGRVRSEDIGIQTDPDKIAVLKEWQPPSNA